MIAPRRPSGGAITPFLRSGRRPKSPSALRRPDGPSVVTKGRRRSEITTASTSGPSSLSSATGASLMAQPLLRSVRCLAPPSLAITGTPALTRITRDGQIKTLTGLHTSTRIRLRRPSFGPPAVPRSKRRIGPRSLLRRPSLAFPAPAMSLAKQPQVISRPASRAACPPVSASAPPASTATSTSLHPSNSSSNWKV